MKIERFLTKLKNKGISIEIIEDKDEIDITDYMGTQDVRMFLKETGYEFSAKEKIGIILISEAPLTIKIALCRQEIKKGYEDNELSDALMKVEDMLLEFLKDDDGKYLVNKSGMFTSAYDVFELSEDYNSALEAAMEASDDFEDDFHMTIRKHYNGEAEYRIEAFYNNEYEIQDIEYRNELDELLSIGIEYKTDINILLPFKKGDILTFSNNMRYKGKPVVLLNDPKWGERPRYFYINDKKIRCSHYLANIEGAFNAQDLQYYKEEPSEIIQLVSDLASMPGVDMYRVTELMNEYLKLHLEIQMSTSNLLQEFE